MSQFLTPTFFCILLFSSFSVAKSQSLRLLPWPTVNAAKSDVGLGTNGKIAFLTFSGITPNIVVMNADGTNQTNLTYGLYPVWSPDGSKIAFARPGYEYDSNIYVINADGSNLKQLTFIEPGDVAGHQSAWSPDGKKIALVLSFGVGFGAGIGLIDADGGYPSTLHVGFYYQGKPAWSPDGTRLAIVASSNNSSQPANCVFVMNADGSGMTCVANGVPGSHVAWSPDGSKLLYVASSDPSHSNLYLVNSSGGTATQLTSGPNNNTAPVWSPDGRLIAFDTDRNHLNCTPSTPCGEIFLMNADGSNQHPIANQPVVGIVYDWQSLTSKEVLTPVPATLQLNAPAYKVSESIGGARVLVTRLGDLSGEASVEFATSDGTARARSDSDFTGYDFWLTKLNQFNGDFQKAEMVKAFITSVEYRSRFGQP